MALPSRLADVYASGVCSVPDYRLLAALTPYDAGGTTASHARKESNPLWQFWRLLRRLGSDARLSCAVCRD